MQYSFNNNVKYRKEKDYILICDCSQLCDYTLPLNKLDLLNKLKSGNYITENDDDKEIIEDLLTVNIIKRTD